MKKYDKEFINNLETILQTNMNSMQKDMLIDFLKRNDKKHESKVIKNTDYPPKVDEVYSKYPDKCPIRGSSTGKNSKCKDKIVKLMELYSAHVIIQSIDYYVKECVSHKIFSKNFLTYLNGFEPMVTEEPKNSEDKVNYLWEGSVGNCRRSEVPSGAIII